MMPAKPLSALALVAGLAAACQQLPPEHQAIADAAEAMGGRQRLLDLTTFVVEGAADAPNVGQNQMPDTELPNWRVDQFTRTIDLATGRMRTEQHRTAQFLFANASTQQLVQGLDGDVAFNVGADGKATRAPQAAAADRRLEMLQHPLVAVRVALADSSKLSGPRPDGAAQLIDIETAAGDNVTLGLDTVTKLPSRLTAKGYHANLGDVVFTTTFADYEAVDGVQVPKRITTTIDKYPQFDLRVSRTTLGGDASRLAAPDDVKSAPAPTPPPQVVDVQPVGKGIWWLAGSGNHRSVVFEFDDHLVLYEVPLNETRSKAVIDKARTLSGKPLTQAIVSHHHFDHSGGIRVAVAEGLQIITQEAAIPFFKELLARKHSVVEDQLAKSPKEATFVPVRDELTLKDGSMEVRLYHLKDNPREGTNLFAYVPRDRMLIQADLYDSTWQFHHWGENVITNIEQRKLKVDRQVPVHGAIQSYADMVKTIRAAPKG